MGSFKSEVDFHHKIAYRFEKAYRLAKKTKDRVRTLNVDIIDCIQDHSVYIYRDPITLFYCLFFCIFYNNSSMVDFLRLILKKIPHSEKIDKLMYYIDSYGVEKIRAPGVPVKCTVYHMVLYQAIDD